MPDTIPAFIKPYTASLKRLCRQYKVCELYLFGSALTSRFHDGSDLDFLVAFKHVAAETYADNFFDFRDALSELFHRKIDLVEVQTLKNPYFRQVIDETKIQVYDGRPRSQMAA